MDKGAEAYRRFLAGEDNALEQVIDLYKDSLIFFLMQYVKGMDIAEELTEDTFVALAVKRPLFRENAKFRTWLFTIARNKALNYLHSAAFRRNVQPGAALAGAGALPLAVRRDEQTPGKPA